MNTHSLSSHKRTDASPASNRAQAVLQLAKSGHSSEPGRVCEQARDSLNEKQTALPLQGLFRSLTETAMAMAFVQGHVLRSFAAQTANSSNATVAPSLFPYSNLTRTVIVNAHLRLVRKQAQLSGQYIGTWLYRRHTRPPKTCQHPTATCEGRRRHA